MYLDHAATSPMRPTVAHAMEPFHDQVYANPSGSHRFARDARRVIDEARDNVAEIIGCRPGEIVFTSGGTEGANTAVLGTIRRRGGIAVCSSAEHHAVLHCVEHVGGRVLPVTQDGVIDPIALRQTLREMSDVSLVSAMAVNNEVGSITDMQEVSRAVRRVFPEAVLHTDAVQSACWIDLRSIWPHVDVLTLSAHKFGGPKGMGIMVVREGIVLEPLLFGGGQERDRRSGTHNVAGIVGTTAALRITDEQRISEVERISILRSRLLDGLEAKIDCAKRTLTTNSVAGIAHICLEGLENESLLYLLDEHGVCASAASACASGAMEPSHVLAAMAVPMQKSKGALRFSLGHTTTESDIDTAISSVDQAVTRLQQSTKRKVTAQ